MSHTTIPFLLFVFLPVISVGSLCHQNFVEEGQLLNFMERVENLKTDMKDMSHKVKGVVEYLNHSLPYSDNLSMQRKRLEALQADKRFFCNSQNSCRDVITHLFLDIENIGGVEMDSFNDIQQTFDQFQEAVVLRSSEVNQRIQEIYTRQREDRAGKKAIEAKPLSLDDLIEDPTQLKANQKYHFVVNGQQWETAVLFSPSIIELFFSSFKSNLDIQILKKNLRSIKKGFNSNPGETGLKPLTRNNNENYRGIFEIKTIGKRAGFVRMGGFDSSGILHIVHYIKGSDHTSDRMNNFIKTILARKKAFEGAQDGT